MALRCHNRPRRGYGVRPPITRTHRCPVQTLYGFGKWLGEVVIEVIVQTVGAVVESLFEG